MTRTLLRSFYAAFALAAAAASVGDTDPRDWDPPLSSASSSSLSTDVRHSRVRQDSSSSSEVGADERELLDVVLVASIDGKFHALNRASGHVLWSMSAPHASTPPAPELGPLVRTAHPEIDPDLHDGQEQYIIEPQSGDIYVLADPAGPLQRLPFSMSRLVDIAPHHSQEGGVERMFVGKKETSLLVIELETGRLLRTINADAACPWERPLDESRFREVDLDDLEDSESLPPSSTHIYIGRTDYHVSIHTSPSPGSSYKPPVQNLLYSVYGPNNEDLPTQATYTRTPDDNYIQSLPGGDVICVTTSNGQKPLRWHKKLPNSDPGVAIFDIVKPRRGGGNGPPIALLQPRPRLEEVLGALPLAEAARAGALPHLDRAFVDMTRSGSLYAMSPDRFPLVIFADAGRLYHSVDGADDRKLTLNELTERRAWRNMCMAEGARNMDPRCLVGPKTLGDPGSSQFGKLLGEVPPKSQKPLDRAPATADRPAAPSPPLTLDAILNSQPNASGDRHGHDLKHGHGRGRGHSELKALPPTTEQPSLPAPHRLLTIGAAPDGSIQSLNALVLVGLGFLLAVLWLRRPASFSMPHVGPPGMAKSSSYQAPPVDRAYVQENTHVQPEQSSEPGSPHRSDASIGARPMTPAALEMKELPPLPPTPLIDTENQPITPSTPRVQLEVSGDGEDESENENDGSPHKRRRPRRRGKKKRAGTTAKEGSEDGGLPTDADKASASGSADERITGKMLIVPSTPTIKEVKTPSLVVSDEILGFGSHGTVVYKGSLQGRAVAVKRLLQDFVTLASREVGILQDSDDHPNVIRYYYQEAHGTFLYIALELCPASLADVVERPDAHQELVAAFDPKRALKQITAGLRHLHALKIVHRDIKPQNILISAAAKSASGRHAGHRMLISDFGLCRRLEIDQTSFLPTAHGNLAAGTVGWRAPEILCGEVNVDSSSFADDNASQSSRGSSSTVNGGNGSGPSAPRPKRLTKSVDIFALGCVFYYTLTNGSHPYGDRYERDTNIVKDKKSLDQLERFGEEGTEAVDLIDAMLNYEPSTRPDTQAIMLHPYFWDSNRRLTFLTDVSDRFEVMCRDPRDAMLVRLETGAPTVVGHDWHQRLDRVFLDNLGKFRKYEGKSVQDLMRALRNKRNHYQDLPDNVKRHVGSMPDGFLAYFTRRFPRLFLHVYGVVGDSLLRTESMFRTYYELQD